MDRAGWRGARRRPRLRWLDAICANLPYVAEEERTRLAPEVGQWEPAEALFSGQKGLEHILGLIDQAPARLSPGGLLLLECGDGQAPTIVERLSESGDFQDILVHADLAGIDRVIQAEKEMRNAECMN